MHWMIWLAGGLLVLVGVCHSAEQQAARCATNEYYDGVTDTCSSCNDICRQDINNLLFCANNCPGLYEKLFISNHTAESLVLTSTERHFSRPPSDTWADIRDEQVLILSDDVTPTRLVSMVTPSSAPVPSSSVYVYVCIGSVLVALVTLAVLVIVCIIVFSRKDDLCPPLSSCFIDSTASSTPNKI